MAYSVWYAISFCNLFMRFKKICNFFYLVLSRICAYNEVSNCHNMLFG